FFYAFYTFVFSAIGFLPFVKPVSTICTLVQSPKAVIIAVVSGILCGILPYIFYTIGLEKLDTSVAGVFVAVEPLVGCIVGIVGFKESADAIKILGIALILSSIIILNVSKKAITL
ncbi:MAG: EamA family transporter, partial [Eubacterium sp.]